MANSQNIAGSFDTSFGTDRNGTVRLELLAGFTRLLKDQTLLTVGNKRKSQTEYVVEAVKHHADGYYDKALAETSIAGFNLFAALTVQADDKYLVLWGLLNGSHYDAHLTRVTKEGDPDPQFNPGNNGTVRLDVAVEDDLLGKRGLKVRDKDGAVYVAFEIHEHDSIIIKIDKNGGIDPLFGDVTGRIYVPDTQLRALAFSDDDHLLVAGNTRDKAIISCYDNRGSLVTGFGSGGHVELGSADTGNPLSVFSIVVDDQHRITVAGSNAKLRQTHNFVASFTASGQPDPTFNQGVPVHTTVEDGSYVSHVVQRDGKVVVLAREQATGLTTKLVRYTRAAHKDPAFGNAGVALVYTRQDSPLRSYVDTVELQHPGEKFLVSGPNATYYTYIARLLNDA
ncbi:hypothetical protein [Pseudomonas sp. PAMC 25886]|jgi:uncharacterized delta-60 repeat protein|uniref:hypothetical protein n=1 Tax=Pseudomonas sp. PAMC 25886 TaxID=1125977 RepID=UPI00028A41C3|nr:hypothetical protein [Pseudomonas sp. PAMC 25886]